MNLRDVLQKNMLVLYLVGLDRILLAKAMKVCMCREHCLVACCSKLDELTALSNGQLMNNELVLRALNRMGRG